MARRSLSERNIRKLVRGSSSYIISLPIDAIKKLKWRKGQKLDVTFDSRRKRFVVRDWKK